MRTSCWECHRKRRICDGEQPCCAKCRRRGISCPGYDKPPLKWLEPGQTRSKGRTAYLEKAVAQVGSVDSHLPKQIRPHDALAIMQSIQYYNEVMIPDAAAFLWNSPSNPYRIDPIFIPYLPQAMMESMICTALAHRIMQTSHDIGSQKTLILAKKLQRHRGEAIRLLGEDLADPNLCTGDATLLTVISLLLSEIQQCTVASPWRQHFNGLHAIFRARGGLRKLLIEGSHSHILKYVLIVDIFGATTSPNVSADIIQSQVDVVDLIPAYFGTNIETCIPCPPSILQLLMQINRQRWVNESSPPTLSEAVSATKGLLQSILSISVHDWATEACAAQLILIRDDDDEGDNNSVKYDATVEIVPHESWVDIASIYQKAAALYCISALYLPYTQTMDSTGQQIFMDLMAVAKGFQGSLLQTLRRISLIPTNHHRKMVMWPLMVAGLTTASSDYESTKFILGELVWIARNLGTASAIVAHTYLGNLWRDGGYYWPSPSRPWDSLFDQPYIFAL
ncbi:hypothetical protein VHEMI07243 [[Torrubiella] hemipterigena]|uniref:Zn(2)-C6 fungal-type domain-containing protein n=1 Tax=[Torrubiella] hemipterigena TaxID=1531966 RepID=A0A0A1T2W1_9HYPO|nr:hypothetical protein VHEMI07243 [[Torrubiella] hemipterigena]